MNHFFEWLLYKFEKKNRKKEIKIMTVSNKIVPNFKILLQYIREYQPIVFPLLMINVIISSLQPFPYIFFSKKLFDLFAEKSSFSEIAFYAILMTFLSLLLNLLNEYFSTKLTQKLERLDYELFKSMSIKTAYLDYFMLNSDDTREKMQSAAKAINGKNVFTVIMAVKSLASGVL